MRLEISKKDKKNLMRLSEYFGKNRLDSDVVSSHWKLYGGKTQIAFSDDYGSVVFNAGGFFDDRRERNVRNLIKNIPISIYLRKLIARLPLVLRQAIDDVVISQQRVISYNCVKHALSISSVISAGVSFENKTVGIIGDGNGYLGLLLKTLFPSVKIVQINLSKVLIFDYLFSSKMNDDYEMNLVLAQSEYSKAADFNFIPAESVFDIGVYDVDFFFNIASMQEMDNVIVNKYFRLIREQKTPRTYFYCCNREEKILPDGSKSIFREYGWMPSDRVIFDEICDWYSEFPVSGPPFVKKFDGCHKHKLIEVNAS